MSDCTNSVRLTSSPCGQFVRLSSCVRPQECDLPSAEVLSRFIAKVEANEHVEAIEEFYAPHASMQENDRPPRVGREALVANERQALARARSVTSACVRPVLVEGDHVVVRWIFEFEFHDDTRIRLEELAYQRWEADRIVEEKFFYDPQQLMPKTIAKRNAVSHHASGTFEVRLSPQTLAHVDADPGLGRMAIDKTFSGDLLGTSQGEMLTAGTAVKGSAAYVAIERVSAKLHGRRGTFELQHFGIMNRGAPQLTVSVVPDSGTDDLAGLTGTLDIKIADGQHFYELDYALPEKP